MPNNKLPRPTADEGIEQVIGLVDARPMPAVPRAWKAAAARIKMAALTKKASVERADRVDGAEA